MPVWNDLDGFWDGLRMRGQGRGEPKVRTLCYDKFMEFSKKDRQWQRLNQKLEARMVESDWFGLGTIYYEMANLVKSENGDPEHYSELGYKMKLKVAAQNLKELADNADVMEAIEVLNADNSCDVRPWEDQIWKTNISKASANASPPYAKNTK
jgi:hypothetical protein